jgi:hypothetical protein
MTCSTRGSKDSVEIGTKTAQDFQPLRRCLQSLLLGLKNLAASRLYQDSDRISQAPPWSSQHLQAVCRGYEERYAPVPNHANTFWKAVKGLEIEPGKIKTLKLFGRVRHEELLAWLLASG